MSKMSDIHAAASEIDTTDADAVQALADSIAAERYAADIAAYADTVRALIESLAGEFCDVCGENLAGYADGATYCVECVSDFRRIAAGDGK